MVADNEPIKFSVTTGTSVDEGEATGRFGLDFRFDFSPITSPKPEPGSLALFASGLLGVVTAGRKRAGSQTGKSAFRPRAVTPAVRAAAPRLAVLITGGKLSGKNRRLDALSTMSSPSGDQQVFVYFLG